MNIINARLSTNAVKYLYRKTVAVPNEHPRMSLATGIIPALRLRLIASSTQILGPNFGTGFRH
jgi:hypothetical protein